MFDSKNSLQLSDYAQLQLSQEEMRRFGYKVIDTIIEHSVVLKDKPVVNMVGRQQMEALLREPAPQKGAKWEDVFEQAIWDIFSHIMHMNHPRLFGWVPGPSNFVSVMADLLATGFNITTGAWMLSSGPTQIEIIVIDWLKEIIGFPKKAGGIMVGGGSIANLSGLTVARKIKLKDKIENAVLYFSDQAHWSNERAAYILGFATDQIRKIPVGADYCMDVEYLRQQIETDKAAGLRPFCIIANAGTTNTGAIDSLMEIYAICEQEDMWLHVDGAYGAAAALSKEAKEMLNGIQYAHSLTVDPHKWFFQPYEVGCLLVKEDRWLAETFDMTADYMRNLEESMNDVNFYGKGLQLTRCDRALKLWMSIKIFGLENFSSAIDRGIKLAKYVQDLWEEREGWQVMSDARLGIVTFRYAPASLDEKMIEELNDAIALAVADDKFALTPTTRLNGKLVMRMCTINPRTSEDDILETVTRIQMIAKEVYNTLMVKQVVAEDTTAAMVNIEYKYMQKQNS
ncbi:pyridoxal phosphate-dependent decarboxylase family protein [Xanthocytophaga agilis]|uniref:Pyridoxal-dependent decarboxylase n=1 Tax=Xanthocytophaga agilis TaxID=3048010 RepID=A0AAE3UCW0_9BACT|nr:pyridoxal-dependent decarboxylase [Xanthocytophaga agilis]MDJ1500535.1 pyridoxal-dependent decarboxylase [Xanthocytophaga agilis]